MSEMPKTMTAADGNQLPICRCPACNYKIDAASAMDRMSRPIEGDLCVCWNCGEILDFGPGLFLRKLPFHDFDAIPSDTKEKLREIRRAIISRGAFKDQ